jgi:2-keto-4-pentenoate hydratase/2-oxohepta-3-ene-1,7-dioic acid hydratase in catechol pathway
MTKFVSYYRADETMSWGRLDGDTIHDATSVAPSLKEAIAADALPRLADHHTGNTVPLADVRLAPVIPDPGKIICIGVNYRTHRDEIGKAAPEAPVVFARYADSQMGHGADATKPAGSDQFDYEGEVALVIGKPAHRIGRTEAYDHVAGYSVYNDFSVRDWQRAASQWLPGKTWPGTGGFGPALVTSDEVGDVTELDDDHRVRHHLHPARAGRRDRHRHARRGWPLHESAGLRGGQRRRRGGGHQARHPAQHRPRLRMTDVIEQGVGGTHRWDASCHDRKRRPERREY